MLIKAIQVNLDYDILPVQMQYYYTNNIHQTIMVEVGIFRIHFKHSDPRYIIKIKGLKYLSDYDRNSIKLRILNEVLDRIKCDNDRVKILC